MPMFNVQNYLATHPNVVNTFIDDPLAKQTYGTLDNFAIADAKGNGTPEEKIAANGTQVIDSGGMLTNNPTLPVETGLGSLINDAAKTGAAGATVNPNTQEVMAANQTGTTQSSGLTNTSGTQTQTGTKSNNTSQNQVTNSAQAGTTIGSTGSNTSGTSTTGQTSQTGTTNTVTPTDTLGFGQLLQNQVTGAQDATATQQSFLKDLVANGPANQQALTARAVNSALSGPGMVGAGDNAQARAASDAASTVATNALNQQLAAAGQLANNTQVTNLATAGNPYVGSSSTGATNTTASGTTNSNQSTGGFSNTATNNTNTENLINNLNSLDISSLINKTDTTTNEQQAGLSNANSSQVGIGTVPENSTSSAGGCYVCTDFVDRGLMHPGAIRRAARWKLSQTKYHKSLVGYSIYGPFAAKHHLVPRSIARLILYEECRLAGVKVPKRTDATGCHAIFHYFSTIVAVLTGQNKIKQCEPSMVAMLSRNNLIFKV
jgi:hypothetical protein